MCLSVVGNRLCAICSLTLKDNDRFPSDCRVYECGGTELGPDGKHSERILVNYRIFVCAYCKEAARVDVIRKDFAEKSGLNDNGGIDGSQKGKENGEGLRAGACQDGPQD